MWRPINFPAILNLDGSRRDDRLLVDASNLTHGYRDEIRLFDVQDLGDSIEPLGNFTPTKILFCKRRRKFRLALLYDANLPLRTDKRLVAEFPAEWARFIAVEYNGKTIYNESSSLNRHVDSDSWREFISLRRGLDAVDVMLSIVAQASRKMASAFILHECDERDCDDWNRLRTANLSSWMAVFRLAGFNSDQDFVLYWQLNNEGDDGFLLRLSIDGATKLRGHVLPGGHAMLPSPKEEGWWLDGNRG